MRFLNSFFKLEAAGGICLFLAAFIAIVLENSPLDIYYQLILSTMMSIQIEDFAIEKPLLLWINDGLMAIFFLLIGLEIKREVLEGIFKSRNMIILPTMAAIGGIIVPALIYVYFNLDNPSTMKGWAIPAATDIAFTLGILALFGQSIPTSLKVLLTAIAIIDDLAAIIIIAIFYTESLSGLSIISAIVCITALYFMNRLHVRRSASYLVVGIILWVCVLKSGIHATLAGVIVAMFIPLKAKRKSQSPLRRLEHDLHPWVSYLIMPVFAFANAGVSLVGLSLAQLSNTVTLGIAMGLFVGKQVGIMLITWLSIRLGLCGKPSDINYLQFYGMSLLTGIGFTMSLFIGTLAFDDSDNQSAVRLGVLLGSVASAICGSLVLHLSQKITPNQEVRSS